MGTKIKTKYTKCPKNDLGYEEDCPLKKALRRLFNDHPGNIYIKDVEFTNKDTVHYEGQTLNAYFGIKLDIELNAEYYFTLQGKLGNDY